MKYYSFTILSFRFQFQFKSQFCLITVSYKQNLIIFMLLYFYQYIILINCGLSSYNNFDIFISQITIMKDQELPPQYIITNFSRTSFTKQPLQDVYFNNHIQKYNQFHRDLSVIKPQRDIYFVEARNLLKYSINLFGSISWKIPEIQQSKLHVLEVKSEEDIYLKEPHRYLQAYRANTAYQVKKVLEYKQDDSQFKQKLIENVRKVEQQFKEQYSKEAQSSLKDKQLKIYLQNCHENTFFQCLQRFKVCQTKSYKMETKKEVTGATKTLDLQQQEKSNQQNQNE